MAVVVNSLSLYLQKKHGVYNRFKSFGMAIHAVVILPLWGVFIVLLCTLKHVDQLSVSWGFNISGAVIMALAVILFVVALKEIGSNALVNGDIFLSKKRTRAGIYKYLKNPIYDSYTLLLFGAAFVYQNYGYLVLAALSIPLLHLFEVKAEDYHLDK